MESNDASQVVQENWGRYLYARDRGHVEYIQQAARCEGMYLGGGLQWAVEDKEVLNAQKRPYHEFNEVMPSVNSAIGYQIQNRMDIAFKPREGDADNAIAEVLSKVVKQIIDQTDFQYKETQVFGDGLIEQRGYFDVRINYESNALGEIDIQTLDPRDVIPDPDAKTYDPENWADVIVTRWLLLHEIEALYGKEARQKVEESGEWDGDFGDLGEPERGKFGSNVSGSTYYAYSVDANGIKRFRIIDRQKHVFELVQCVVFPDSGDIKPVSDMTQEQLDEALANGAVLSRRMKKRVRWIVSTYYSLLLDVVSPYESFTVVPYFGYFRRGKTRGMVDNAISPQEALNKAVSKYDHILSTSANSGWMVEEDSLSNMTTDELKASGAKTGLIVEYKKGTRPPQKITPNSVPSGIDRMIDRATQALKDVTVPDSMRGLQGRDMSGIAKQMDQYASFQQLAIPLENLAFTRRMVAKRILCLVQRYYDSHRIFRITEMDSMTGKPTESTLEINKPDGVGGYLNDITLGTYDVVVTNAPMRANFGDTQFDQAIQMREKGIRIPDSVVVKYSSLSDKHEIMSAIDGAQQQQPEDPTLRAKAELIAAQARKTDADATARAVEAQYSSIQAAQVITQVPQVSQLADKLLKSAGYVDKDTAPIIPPEQQQQGSPVPPMNAALPPHNTNPMTPSNPAVGMMQGIETARPDGVLNQSQP